MSRTRVVVLSFLVLAGCVGRKHYPDYRIVEPPAEDRKVLFDCDAATSLVRKKQFERYDSKVIRWTASVLDICDDGSPVWPLRLSADVYHVTSRLRPDCIGYFGTAWRDDLARLRTGDTVTVVGFVMFLSPLEVLQFGDCELIRAERDGKQIYPPPETEKKP